MTTLLKLTTSLFSDEGQSSALVNHFVDCWLEKNPGAKVISRDLGREPIPHLTGDGFRGFRAAPEDRTSAQRAVVAYSDGLIDELKSAEVIVLGLPMYNFGVSSSLKCYFDHIARAGVTFRYTDKGPMGLLSGHKAYVVAARGGRYAGTEKDSQTAHVRSFLQVIGIVDIVFVYAEGLSLNEDAKQTSLASARAKLVEMAALTEAG